MNDDIRDAARTGHVTAADHVELHAQRTSQAEADIDTLSAVVHHTDRRVVCFWCTGRVFQFASTPDGERHYCGGCVRRIRARYGFAGMEGAVCPHVWRALTCALRPGHPGRHRDGNGRVWSTVELGEMSL